MTQTYPEATVGALVVNSSGKVLIVRSSKWSDKYTVPGGHIELGERAEDAITRVKLRKKPDWMLKLSNC